MDLSLCYFGWVPRHNTAVKKKDKKKLQNSPHSLLKSAGFVDIHFHGAFGVDVLTASPALLDDLSAQLWKNGISGFCPTTLSLGQPELKQAISQLGPWIASRRKKPQNQKLSPSAIPLGIHLEGPFLNPQSSGAHPRGGIRPLDLSELETLWEISQNTLCLMTLAPELLSPLQLSQVVTWAKKRKITLSMGHTRATQTEATHALEAGIAGLTHGWNAMPFHQREPGALGATLRQPHKFVELIIDHAHVHPTVLSWTLALHGYEQTCFVSDCVPPAGLPQHHEAVSFGPLTVRQEGGASRLPDGSLAGGGLLLPEAYCQWIERESKDRDLALAPLFKKSIVSATTVPLAYLGLSPSLFKKDALHWQISRNSVRFSRISR